MEREHIYFRGQADALAYLNKVGAFKMEQWLKTLRSDMHRLKEYLHIKPVSYTHLTLPTIA